MKVIPKKLWIQKLFTLKHSCLLTDFTLKRSCLYAETLLFSIYTYIHMYYKTCSWQQQNGNIFFYDKSKVLSLCLLICAISGCCKQNSSEMIQDVALNLSSPPHRAFHQIFGNIHKPSAYYTCGQMNPCPYKANIGKQINFLEVNKSKMTNHFNFKGE
ncbi:MAG: hypothetical protein KIT56_10335 [Gammaproteobacteria bacterium]|nr:hypothetical protein [Gammaproteobacteria bacterium]MCW5584247.1 hypothetical protein [Gammaproteobacteria bacterium]